MNSSSFPSVLSFSPRYPTDALESAEVDQWMDFALNLANASTGAVDDNRLAILDGHLVRVILRVIQSVIQSVKSYTKRYTNV